MKMVLAPSHGAKQKLNLFRHFPSSHTSTLYKAILSISFSTFIRYTSGKLPHFVQYYLTQIKLDH
ncbi:hypothetical protein BLOT_011777 [Blomia tropicalis]|nr:hypothetical protein BLOT_011777 [Blomia tropicalis]